MSSGFRIPSKVMGDGNVSPFSSKGYHSGAPSVTSGMYEDDRDLEGDQNGYNPLLSPSSCESPRRPKNTMSPEERVDRIDHKRGLCDNGFYEKQNVSQEKTGGQNDQFSRKYDNKSQLQEFFPVTNKLIGGIAHLKSDKPILLYTPYLTDKNCNNNYSKGGVKIDKPTPLFSANIRDYYYRNRCEDVIDYENLGHKSDVYLTKLSGPVCNKSIKCLKGEPDIVEMLRANPSNQTDLGKLNDMLMGVATNQNYSTDITEVFNKAASQKKPEESPVWIKSSNETREPNNLFSTHPNIPSRSVSRISNFTFKKMDTSDYDFKTKSSNCAISYSVCEEDSDSIVSHPHSIFSNFSVAENFWPKASEPIRDRKIIQATASKPLSLNGGCDQLYVAGNRKTRSCYGGGENLTRLKRSSIPKEQPHDESIEAVAAVSDVDIERIKLFYGDKYGNDSKSTSFKIRYICPTLINFYTSAHSTNAKLNDSSAPYSTSFSKGSYIRSSVRSSSINSIRSRQLSKRKANETADFKKEIPQNVATESYVYGGRENKSDTSMCNKMIRNNDSTSECIKDIDIKENIDWNMAFQGIAFLMESEPTTAIIAAGSDLANNLNLHSKSQKKHSFDNKMNATKYKTITSQIRQDIKLESTFHKLSEREVYNPSEDLNNKISFWDSRIQSPAWFDRAFRVPVDSLFNRCRLNGKDSSLRKISLVIAEPGTGFQLWKADLIDYVALTPTKLISRNSETTASTNNSNNNLKLSAGGKIYRNSGLSDFLISNYSNSTTLAQSAKSNHQPDFKNNHKIKIIARSGLSDYYIHAPKVANIVDSNSRPNNLNIYNSFLHVLQRQGVERVNEFNKSLVTAKIFRQTEVAVGFIDALASQKFESAVNDCMTRQLNNLKKAASEDLNISSGMRKAIAFSNRCKGIRDSCVRKTNNFFSSSMVDKLPWSSSHAKREKKLDKNIDTSSFNDLANNQSIFKRANSCRANLNPKIVNNAENIKAVNTKLDNFKPLNSSKSLQNIKEHYIDPPHIEGEGKIVSQSRTSSQINSHQFTLSLEDGNTSQTTCINHTENKSLSIKYCNHEHPQDKPQRVKEPSATAINKSMISQPCRFHHLTAIKKSDKGQFYSLKHLVESG